LTDETQSAILLIDQRETTARVSGAFACGLTEENTTPPAPGP
jgi:hypothetical protein